MLLRESLRRGVVVLWSVRGRDAGGSLRVRHIGFELSYDTANALLCWKVLHFMFPSFLGTLLHIIG